MLILDGNKIKLGAAEERITQWEVWFHTPWGLVKDVHEAVQVCKANEIDPEGAIVPIPVAVGPSLYEAYHRG